MVAELPGGHVPPLGSVSLMAALRRCTMKFFCKLSPRPFLILLLFLTATAWPDQAMAAHQITIAWAYTSTLEDGFKIERETGTNGTFAQIATVAAIVTSYTDTQVTS